MHRLAAQIVAKPEIQESKATYVQAEMGYTFEELVYRALQDPVTNQQIKANVRTNSKKMAIEQCLDGTCVTHPKYMTDKQQKTFLEGLQEDFNIIERARQAYEQEMQAKQVSEQQTAFENAVQTEVERRLKTPAAE